ncbi:MAG: phospholipase D-like domain-containing protein [Rhizonema sp. PD38]|nr:phospholipase D-like domain-containing protein [Rhizonema sp. PD38]
MIQTFEALLQRNVYIDIGWGHQKDIDKLPFGSGSIRRKLESFSYLYNALPKLETLEQKYSTQFKLKLLGTHEKFIVYDHSWAMLGSHNFLTSGNNSAEREVGLQTNDPRIITDLILRFDKAKNLEDKG